MPVYVLVPMYALLLALNGLFTGMNLAFFCISHSDIILLQRYNQDGAQQPQQQQHAQTRQAQAILELRKHSNWLVCTLVFGNTLVNILSTLLTDDACNPLSDHATLVVTNTVPVLLNMFFGEIFPQAFVNKRGLKVAKRTLCLAKFFMVVFAPVSWPLSVVLDCLIGRQGPESLDMKTFEGMVKLQMTSNLPKEMLDRAFRFKDVTAGRVMTSINDAFLLSSDDVLDMNVSGWRLRDSRAPSTQP